MRSGTATDIVVLLVSMPWRWLERIITCSICVKRLFADYFGEGLWQTDLILPAVKIRGQGWISVEKHFIYRQNQTSSEMRVQCMGLVAVHLLTGSQVGVELSLTYLMVSYNVVGHWHHSVHRFQVTGFIGRSNGASKLSIWLLQRNLNKCLGTTYAFQTTWRHVRVKDYWW